MSDTPKLPDESKKLLDNGWTICLYRGGMGSYTAVALSGLPRQPVQIAIEAQLEEYDEDDGPAIPGVVVTDDFEPSQALYRLTEKVFGRIA